MMKTRKLPQKIVQHEDWRMSVYAEPWHDIVTIWLMQTNPKNGQAYNVTYENGNMLLTAVKEGSRPEKPFLKIPIMIYDDLCQLLSLVEIPQEEEVTKAELRATKYHLEDMRKLALKK